MKHFQYSIILQIIFAASLLGQPKTYYVSLSGSDSNSGLSIDQPLATIASAVSKIAAGDTIYVRGGTYVYTGSSTAITIPIVSGTSATVHCNLLGYHNERVLLDFSSMSGTSADGLKINGSYWYIKGFDCKGAPHNGIKISAGNYNTIEFCSSFSNRNTGVQLSSGASYNRIINCDSYYNYDAPAGGNADGFSPKLDVGTGNYFYGCRAYQNSDDGWDGYLRPSDDVTTTIENCWSFMNGILADGVTIKGNGNGFKMGGSDSKDLKHNMIVKNCLSFYNKAKGFDQNHSRGSLTLYNCTGFNNGNGSTSAGDLYNFAYPETLATTAGKVLTIKNCISLGSTYGIQLCPSPTIVVTATNSWLDSIRASSTYTTATAADFISTDTTGVRGARKADGSLPDITFMHLVPGSHFIDAGTNVGLAFNGTAPDLGCFETNAITGIGGDDNVIPLKCTLAQNYPNPFNPSTVITYQIAQSGIVSVKVYDLLGREVASLVNEYQTAGGHSLVFDASRLGSGIYFYRLQTASYQEAKKMVLLK